MTKTIASKILLKTLLVFSPIIMVTILIILYIHGYDFLYFLNNIDGNNYPVNNILLSYIVASYVVIFIGLISYYRGIMRDIFYYKGDDERVLKINSTCGNVAALVLIIFSIYLLYFVIATMIFNPGGSWIFNIHNLVQFNKWLSLIVFFAFFYIDLRTEKSQNLQLTENEVALTKIPESQRNSKEHSDLRFKIEENKNNVQFSKDATWFINIPTLIISASAIALSELVLPNERFQSIVDQSFQRPLLVPHYRIGAFELFAHGFETGIITAGLVVSQIIFMVIKARWHKRSADIKKSCVHQEQQQIATSQ